MDLERIGLALFGAVVGAGGWLVVGMYLQRRDVVGRARSAARAVWFELRNNEVNVELARDHAQFLPLARATFDRLLPELAAWFQLEQLEAVARAYQGHAGYEQAWHDERLPEPVRRQVLSSLLEAHRLAADILAGRAFDGASRRQVAVGRGSDPAAPTR